MLHMHVHGVAVTGAFNCQRCVCIQEIIVIVQAEWDNIPKKSDECRYMRTQIFSFKISREYISLKS